MVVGNVPEAADFVVIGAGPGGYTAALDAAHRGRKVMLIDRAGEAGVGGVCLNVGCIPSKTLIESADLYHRAAHAENQGLPPVDGPFDLERFQTFRARVVSSLAGGVRAQLQAANVEIIAGTVTLTDSHVLVINTPDNQARFVQFKSLVIATGSSPIELPGLPFSAQVVDSTAFLAQTSLPKNLLVVGGGYIGLELGTAAAKLGVSVTIVEAETRLLPAMPEMLAGPISRRLSTLGIQVALGTRVLDFDGAAVTAQDANGKEAQYPADQMLVAVGRRPNTLDLGLDMVLGDRPAGVLEVTPDRLVTRDIAAVGDITPGPALAHKASAEATVAVQALCGERVAFEPAAIPSIVFSDPEIGSAGLSYEAAGEAGLEAERTRVPLGISGRAATLAAREGFAEIVWERDGGAVIGVHIAAPHASELIAEAVVAIEMGVTVEDLSLVVHPHPTLSELLGDTAVRAQTQGETP